MFALPTLVSPGPLYASTAMAEGSSNNPFALQHADPNLRGTGPPPNTRSRCCTCSNNNNNSKNNHNNHNNNNNVREGSQVQRLRKDFLKTP